MKKLIRVLPLLLTAGLLQACGQKELAIEQPGSFAAVAETQLYAAPEGAGSADELKPDSNRPDEAEKDTDKAAHRADLDLESSAAGELQKSSTTEAKSADKADGAVQETPANKSAGDTIEPSAKNVTADDKSEPSGNKAAGSPEKSSNNESTEDQAKKVAEQTTGKAELKTAAEKPSTKSGSERIGWSEFFDGDDQTTPSERFWDLSGSTVTIKGFMGEVLSFEKNWFLLIPEPGAECPFDNGDETYWNKIMIVFVPDDVKLRYKSEPLEITGRLDVGIKIDESGYKTMFRLYDASFKEIKS